MTCSEIHIWGDSLARGVIYNEQKGRYAISGERCSTQLQSALGYKVVNHSVMGATVENGLRAFEGFLPVKDALCAIEFGGNDCDLNWAEVAAQPEKGVCAKVPLERYQQALSEFVTKVRALDMQPLLVTPLPLHAPRYFAWVTKGLNQENVLQALGDVEHIYRWQERYTIAMRRVAAALDCRLMDMRDVFLALDRYEDYMCIDGIHPNDAGHRVITEAVLAMAARDGFTPCDNIKDQSRAG